MAVASHLLVEIRTSVEHALFPTPSSDSLFAEEAIRDLLPPVWEDSQLTFLKNFSSV